MHDLVEIGTPQEEKAQTCAWRYEQLLALGLSDGDALAVACDARVDLNDARELVRERACPPALAAAILL